MRTGWTAVAASALAVAGTPSHAATPAASAPLPEPPASANVFRLGPAPIPPIDHNLRLDDPLGRLRSGFGGALIDVFPIEKSAFRLSVGSRLFGRPGRLRELDPECLHLLPAFRMPGMRPRRRFTPVALVGYGHAVQQGVALGIDAGVMMGRLSQGPDRFGRLRLGGFGERPHGGGGMNPLARVTMLYRF